MVTAVIFLVSFCLLSVSPDATALMWGDFPSWKFLLNLFTHQLDHANFRHFLGNFMFMLPYAVYLEKKLGSLKFFFFYFLTGLMAAGTQFIYVMKGGGVGVIGSSGVAFAVFAAACLSFNDRWWKRMASMAVLGFALSSQLYAALTGWGMVAYWAHIGGAVAGASLAYYWLPFQPKKQDQDQSPSQ